MSPEPPVNVRLVFADDRSREVPVDCVFVGVEIERVNGRLERVDAWFALNPRDEVPVGILVDYLPARSTLRVGYAPDREDKP